MQWPPRPGPGIERHEAERLRLGRLDHLPDVDAHRVADDLQLVDQRDVDGAEDVLGQLHGLGHRAATTPARPRPRAGRRAPRRAASASGVVAADHLGDRGGVEVGVARVLALRREGEEEVRPPSARSARGSGPDHLRRWCRDRWSIRARRAALGAARPRWSARPRSRTYRSGSRCCVERRRHADQDGVAGREALEIAVTAKRPPWRASVTARAGM